jgi:hypothetical protein
MQFFQSSRKLSSTETSHTFRVLHTEIEVQTFFSASPVHVLGLTNPPTNSVLVEPQLWFPHAALRNAKKPHAAHAAFAQAL